MKVSEFRNWCLDQVGKPYILGANGPKAYDCSSLVLAAWRQAGITIGDMTAATIYNITTPSSPKVGAVVFLRNNPARSNGIGHMAVITKELANGDWEIVEARGRASGVVRTTLSYWRTRKYYVGPRSYSKLVLEGESVPAPNPVRPTIRRGSKNKEAVKALQTALRNLNYRGDINNSKSVVVDGVFGTQTERAVKRFQKHQKVSVDGIVGPITWSRLGVK